MSDYVIGKMYSVPCVENPPWKNAGRWLPILGPLHEDAEIVKFEYRHYHIDWRFVSKSFFTTSTWGLPPRSPLGRVLSPDLIPGFAYQIINRRMKCKRTMPEFPVTAPWLSELEQEFESARLGPNLICPHRGMPINGCPIKDGNVVCPGHGLRWNIETGELDKRTK